MTHVLSSTRRSRNAPATHGGQVLSGLARFGLTARGVVYVVIGWLAVQIALGHGSHEANQRGAVADIAQHSFGLVLLWILGLGLAAYAIWRLSEAAFGTPTDGKKVGPRLKTLVQGIVYAAFSVTTFSFIAGRSRQGQAQQQATATARLMKHTDGRWLVGAIGVVIVVVGLVLIFEGVTRRFEKQLRMNEMSPTARRVVDALGVAGSVARGIVFAIAGALIIDAAVSFDPQKSTGLDGALRKLADRPYGPVLLGVVAIGLVAFGLFSLASARWAKT